MCNKLIEWILDGWIGLSGCGCGKWKVDSVFEEWRGSGSHILVVYLQTRNEREVSERATS